MSLPVVLRAEAGAEFDDAFDWYNARQAGLGLEFMAEVHAAFAAIAADPFLLSVYRISNPAPPTPRGSS